MNKADRLLLWKHGKTEHSEMQEVGSRGGQKRKAGHSTVSPKFKTHEAASKNSSKKAR